MHVDVDDGHTGDVGELDGHSSHRALVVVANAEPEYGTWPEDKDVEPIPTSLTTMAAPF